MTTMADFWKALRKPIPRRAMTMAEFDSLIDPRWDDMLGRFVNGYIKELP